MRKLALALLTFVPIPAVVVAVNLAADPAHLFTAAEEGYEEGVATILLDGRGVAGVTNHDERKVIKSYAERLKTRKDVLVFGSSRTMQVRQSMFPGRSFFNASFSGASLEEEVAAYHLFRSRSLIPSVVILGLDAAKVNPNRQLSVKPALEADYRAGLAWLRPGSSSPANPPRTTHAAERYLQLLSPTYFQASVRKLAGPAPARGRGADYQATDEEDGERAICRPDGSHGYSAAFRNAPPEKVRELASKDFDLDTDYRFGRFDRLDQTVGDLLHDFLRGLRADGVEVVVLLSPYHPRTFAQMRPGARLERVSEAEQYFRQVADQAGTEVVGSYDPAAVGAGEEEFFDGHHPREEVIRRILATRRTGRRE